MKKKWVFLREYAISEADSNYWISILKKILKVGLEFEYNLPSVSGSCSGDEDSCGDSVSSSCPCVMKDKYSCESRCLHDYECSQIPVRSRCEEHLNGNCKVQDYPNCAPDCSRWKRSCLGSACVDFEAPCNHGCIFFQKECSNCIEFVNNIHSPRNIRSRATKEFKPLKAFDKLSSTGVYDVTEDGSLLGEKGIEVITTGRRFIYHSTYPMIENIINFCKENGAYVNCRCGLHIHLLASWLETTPMRGEETEYSELERPMPDIILANLHQLYRRFSAAIVWLTSTGDSTNHLTRWVKFRKSILPYSPINGSMADVIKVMRAEIDSYRPEEVGKYAIVNYNWVRFDEDDKSQIKRFHVEFRCPDGNMSPTATFAIVALHWALALKAAKISRWGLLEAFTVESLALQKMVLSTLLNNPNNQDHRVSVTGDFFNNGYDSITREDALQLIRLLKVELMQAGDGVYEVLCSLAKDPMSLRRIRGMNWDEIEDSLKVSTVKLDPNDVKVEMMIEMGTIPSTARSKEEYIRALAEALDVEVSKDDVSNSVEKLVTTGKITWNESIGAFIKL